MSPEISYQIHGQPFIYKLEKDVVIIGRSKESDLVINHASISRTHAKLYREGDAWRVIDLKSKNGTRLNNLGHTDRDLRNGDKIWLHELALVFVDPSVPAAPVTPLADGPSDTAMQTVFRTAVDFNALAAPRADVGLAVEAPTERLRKLVTIVSGASEVIVASKSLDETFQRMLDLVFEHMPVQRGFIMLWDDERKDLVTKCVRHATSAEEIRFSRTIAEKVYREKVAVLTTDAQVDERFAEGKSIVALGIRSAMAAPLWNGDQVDGLIYVDTTYQAKAFDDFDLDLLSALGNHLAVAAEQARLQIGALEKEKLDRELAVAREIQMGFLPQTMPLLPGYDLAGLSQPADQTGGDTFDLIPLDENRLMLLLGDATGHGIGPALSATQVRSMLRIALRLDAGLDDAFRHINDQLAQDLADNRFVTAFLGLLDRRSHQVRYHAGGQGPLLHFHAASGECEWRGSTTVPMGFMSPIPLKEAETVELAPGDILGLITDGVFEYANAASEMFGEERVAQLIGEHHQQPMARLIEVLLQAVQDFGESQDDDITIVLVRRLPI